jgi:PAS domain S-box-containing protein
VILSLLLAAGSATPSFAETDSGYHVRQWQTEQGLPENSATSMVQTFDGFLWFGTFNGLVRFDGFGMQVLNTSNTPALPHDGIYQLLVDKSGSLWVSTLGGLARYRNGKWESFGAEAGWVGSWASALAEGTDGSIYFSTLDGHLLRYSRGRFTELPGLPLRSTAYLYVARDGRLIACQGSKIYILQDGAWIERALPVTISDVKRLQVWLPARGRGLWMQDAGRGLLHNIDDEGRVRRSLPFPGAPDVWDLTEDADGTVWISSATDGLYRLDKDGRLRVLNKSTGFLSDSFRFLFTDSEGNHWAGTNGKGLIRLTRRSVQSFSLAEGLPDKRITSLAALPDGSKLVGTYGRGLYRLKDGRAVPYRSLELPATVQTLLRDSGGRVWAGTYEFGLWALDPDRPSEKPVRISGTETGPCSTIEALYQDRRGRIWVGCTNGVGVWERGAFSTMPINRRGPVAVRYFAEDPATGVVFGAGDGGLYREANGRFESLNDDRGTPLPPLAAICFAAPSKMWLGTSSGELLYWDQGNLASIGADQGLTARNIGDIILGGGSIWLATNQGLWRGPVNQLMAVARGQTAEIGWQMFGIEDGMPSLEISAFHQPSTLREQDGVLWIPTLKGVARIDPQKVRAPGAGSPVRLQTLSFQDDSGAKHVVEIDRTNSLWLPSESRHIRVTFTAIHTTAPEKLMFSYELKRDGRRIASGSSTLRELIFYQLDPGAHELHLRVRNGEGVWSREAAVLRMQREPYLWESRLTWVGVALLLGGALSAAAWFVSRRGMQRQIAEMKQQQEVSLVKARLAAVLENTSDAVGFGGLDGSVQYLNRAALRLFGVSDASEVAFLQVSDLCPPATWGIVQNEVIPSAKEQGSWQGQLIARRTDGQEVPVWLTVAVNKGKDGDPEFLSAIARDVTEMRRAEQALQEAKEAAEKASQLKSEFLANMSHEIRTPMNGILGMSEMLLMGALDPGQRKLAETVLQSAKAMSQLLSDILDSSRIEAGRLQLVQGVFNPRDVVDQIFDLVRTIAQNKGLALSCTMPEGLPTAVVGDHLRVRQIVLNFVDNALKFTAAGSVEIELQVLERVPDGRVTLRFSVTDTGVGIAADQVPLLFEKFRQLDSSSTRRHGGAGLGLSITRKLAEMMGGSVGVDSIAGHGSTFWAEIPFLEVASTAVNESFAPVAAVDSTVAARRRSARILLVEDNNVNRFVATRMLEKLGCAVECASNGAEAVSRFESHSAEYDLILMDVHMPEMNGFEATARIRAAEDSPNAAVPHRRTPIIALTASAMEQDREHCAAAGMDDYLSKPVRLDQLAEALQRNLDECLPDLTPDGRSLAMRQPADG